MLPVYAGLGWQVTGFEPDPDFCQAAQAMASGHDSIKVECKGFLELEAESAFDLITAINDPIAYLLDPGERMEALRRVYRALRSGGVLILEIKNFLYKLLYHTECEEETLVIDGERIIHIMQHDIDLNYGTWTHRDEYLIEGQNTLLSKKHTVAIISPGELRYTIDQAGFVDLQTFNSYEAAQSERWNGRLLLLSARKAPI
jgi:SAM-dependent methyltransferase